MLRTIIKASLALGVTWLALNSNVAKANQIQRADFEVQPIQNIEQVDKSMNYFDVRFKPGTTRTLRMRVQNFTDHPITLESTLENGMTQEGGDMKFQTSTTGLDASLKQPLTTIAKLAPGARKIHLEPQSATIVSATVKMPAEEFRGMIAGGWRFKQILKNKGRHSQSVTSHYAYLMSINLRGKPYRIYPEMKYAATQPMLADGHPALGIKLRNTQPMIIKDVAFKATITKNGLFKSKRVFEKDGSSIAPNSTVILPLSWQYRTLHPGTYHVDVEVTGQNFWNQLPMTWHFKEAFKVTRKGARVVNQKANKRPLNRWGIVSIMSGIALMIASYGLYRQLRRKK